ncbi:MAG: hypothetical protein KIS79_07865 [Burkholderiales bacterium]|nr:hypothetical protein [Burkholderiales bacterium]
MGFEAIPVIESKLSGQGAIQGLIGRDILRECNFTYNGEAGFYILSI